MYEIDVIADVVGRRKPVKLRMIKLTSSNELATALSQQDGVLLERKSAANTKAIRAKNDAQRRFASHESCKKKSDAPRWDRQLIRDPDVDDDALTASTVAAYDEQHM